MICMLVFQSCAVTGNLSDGYDKGDITKGLVEDVKIYCSFPASVARKAGRTVLFFTTGITVPDPCFIK